MKLTREQLEALPPNELNDLCAMLIGWQKINDRWAHPNVNAGLAISPADFATDKNIGILESRAGGTLDGDTPRDKAIAFVLAKQEA